MAESNSFWNFITAIFSKSKSRDITNEIPVLTDDTNINVTTKNIRKFSENSVINVKRDDSDKFKNSFTNLKRHDTCSIDLSDKTLRLHNLSQFKSMESPSNLTRTNSIDLTRDFPNSMMQIEEFEELDVLGEGAFGRAVKVRHIKTNHYFVLKEVLSHSKENEESIIREVSLLRTLNHQNVLTCLGLVLKDKRICLLIELMHGGSLQSKIQDLDQSINVVQKIQFLRDIAAGMDYLHRNSIMHRDLTSSNCLLRKNNSVVVSDFGLSKLLTRLQLSKASLVRSSNYLKWSSSTEAVNKLDSLSYENESVSPLSPLTKTKLSIPSSSKSTMSLSRNFLSVTDVSKFDYQPVASKFRSTTSTSGCGVDEITKIDNSDDEFLTDITEYQVKRKITNIRRKHTVVGNPFWMAPEMLAGKSYNFQVDLYSFGIIGCEITARVSAHPDFLDRKTKDMSVDFPFFLKKNIANHRLDDCPSQLLDMIGSCCDADSDNRPGFEFILTWLEDALFRISNNKPLKSESPDIIE